jgi:hypothetical protein
MAGKNSLVGGSFQDFKGNVLANGYLTMQLNRDGQESVDPGQVFAGFPIRVPLDTNGNILGTVMVWPNDQLNPANSYYIVNAYRTDGTQAWASPQNLSVTSTPSPFNVGNWVPATTNNVVAPVGSLLLQTNGINDQSQSLLNLVAGSGVTLTNTGGAVTITSGATANETVAPAYLGNWEGTPYLVAPQGSGFFSNGVYSNQVQVFMFRLVFPFEFALLTIRTGAVGTPSPLVGIGVYSTSGNLLLQWSGISLGGVPTYQATPTGGPVTLQPGYYYWAFACSTTVTCESAGGLVQGGSGENEQAWNQSVVRGGFAANAMSAGVLPSTLGTLTPGFNVGGDLPLWIVEP